MRRLVVVALAASSVLHAGCSALLDYSEFQNAEADASSPGDSGLPSDAGEPAMDAASPPDGGPRDASTPDAWLPPGCTTDLEDPQDIALGGITDLPSPVGNLPFDVVGDEGGQVALAWVIGDGTARLRAWSIDVEGGSATNSIDETDALRSIDTTRSSIAVAHDGESVVVIGSAGIGGRAARCGASACTFADLPSALQGPLAVAQRAGDFVLVHTGEGPSFSTIWRASTYPTVSTIDLATAPASLIPIDAAGRGGHGYVALAGVSSGGVNRATFLWFGRPPSSVDVTRSVTGIEPIGSLHIAYDAATETAIGVATELFASSARTHLLTAQAGEPGATSHTTWTGNGGPVVSRGDGTFFVSDASGYSLRAVADPATVIAPAGTPGDTSQPLVVAGRYAVLYISVGVPNEINLRVYPCR